MSWDQVIGHEQVLERFRRTAKRHRLASTYLFLGPDGIGKRSFALKLAESMLCETNDLTDVSPCGSCSGCIQVQNRTHPDLLLISKPIDKNVLPVELFIGRSTHRRKEGLVYEIGMKPFRGGFRIAIIDDADYFNNESANCLLKTLEEPPPHSLLILLGTSQQRQLHTIVSRSQLVRFAPLTPAELLQVLNERAVISDEEITASGITREHLAQISDGSVTRALALADPDTYEFRRQLLQQLAIADPHANQFAKSVVAFAEAVGKEGYRRRPRLVLAGELVVEFLRQTYRQLSGMPQDFEDDVAVERIRELADRLTGSGQMDPLTACERLADCIQRTGEMQFHTTTNAQMLNVVESWLIDLGRLMRGESVTTGDVLSGIA